MTEEKTPIQDTNKQIPDREIKLNKEIYEQTPEDPIKQALDTLKELNEAKIEIRKELEKLERIKSHEIISGRAIAGNINKTRAELQQEDEDARVEATLKRWRKI